MIIMMVVVVIIMIVAVTMEVMLISDDYTLVDFMCSDNDIDIMVMTMMISTS